MSTVPPSGYPPRWDVPPLDTRTVEWIARLNEDERRNLIELSHLSDKNLERLKAMLAMDGEVWEAGVKLATRSAFWTRVTKRFPLVVGAIAALLVAGNTIWGFAGPWLKILLAQGGKP